MLAESGRTDLRTYTLGFTSDEDEELNELRRTESALRERLATLNENVHGLEMQAYEKKLHLSLAMQRTTFGESESSVPSRFLAEIPDSLIDWRESGVSRSIGSSMSNAPIKRDKPRTEWKGAISSVRDNGDLALAPGDQIEHADFGRGKVLEVSGEPPRQTAEIRFDNGSKKRLLVKVAPITKL